MSLAFYGADKTKFPMPHFITNIKDERGHGLTVHLIGLLVHATASQLRLFIMTYDHATGANHIIEAIHRLVDDES